MTQLDFLYFFNSFDFTFFVDPQLAEEARERGTNMGKGLNRMSRRQRGKLPLVIPEGRLRPEAPIIAAKFATECNITVRNHVPVFTHWKHYKKQNGIFMNFVGKVGVST